MENENEVLQELVQDFAEEMTERMLSRIGEREGWEDHLCDGMGYDELRFRIIKNALDGDWLDVANLAAMARYHYGL